MVFIIVKLIVVGLLFITFLQDLRERAVHLFLFPLLLLGFIAISLQNNSWPVLAGNYLLNLLFLAIQIIVLYAYFSIRKGKPTAIVGVMMGWGDILFWLVTGAVFTPANYIFFFLASLIFSLFFHFLLSIVLVGEEHTKVPLAGHQALFLIFMFILQLFFPNLNFYNDSLLLESWL